MSIAQHHPDRALVPTSKGVRLFSFIDGQVQDAIHTGLAKCQRHAWLDGSTVAVLTHPVRRYLEKWQQVRVLRIEERRIQTIATLETPIAAYDIISFGGRLIICGEQNTGSYIFALDTLLEGQWTPLSMPSELGCSRHTIRAFASDGSQLITIDSGFSDWMGRYMPDGSSMPRLADFVCTDWLTFKNMACSGSCQSCCFAPLCCSKSVGSVSSGTSWFALHSVAVMQISRIARLEMRRFDNLAGVSCFHLPLDEISVAMQGDTAWLLQQQYPDQIFCVEPMEERGGLDHSLPPPLPLPCPCRALVRSWQGDVFAIPQDDEAAPIHLSTHFPSNAAA